MINKTSKPYKSIAKGKVTVSVPVYKSSLNKKKGPSGKTKGPQFEFKPKLLLLPSVCHHMFPKFSVEDYKAMLQAWSSYVMNTINNEGLKTGAKKYKLLRSYTLALVEGRNPEPLDWVAVGRKDRIPSKLDAARPLIKEAIAGNKQAYKALNTLLYTSRILDFHAGGSYDSIQGKFELESELKEKFRDYIKKRLTSIAYEQPKEYKYVQPLTHGVSGPNGKPKIESAYMEALTLVRDPIFWVPFKGLCESFGFNFLTDYLTSLNRAQHLVKHGGTHLRKLITVADSDCKTRVVAISDFWTQSLLEALLPTIKYLLRKLFSQSSGYWNHENGFNKMKGSTLSDLKSYDLVDWTDKFHHDLQYIMMELIFSREIAENWFKLVVLCPWFVQELNRKIVYGMGQGMGTTGSFLIATLADHFYLEMVMSEHYGSAFGPDWYNKTGDDLVINDPDSIIPLRYQQIGSEINLHKSKMNTHQGRFIEYVSRVSWDGIDVSRISPKIINRSSDWRYVPLLLHVAGKVDLKLPCNGLPTLDKITKEGRSYRSLLADLLVTLKWVEQDNNFQSFVRMDWETIKELGYLDEATLDPDNVEDAHDFRLAKALINLQKFSFEMNDTAFALNTHVPDIMDMFNMCSDDTPFWDMSHERYKTLARQESVVKYTDKDGSVIIAPRSIFAAYLYHRDVIFNQDSMITSYNANMLGQTETNFIQSAIKLEKMQTGLTFQNFKDIKEGSTLRMVIDSNLQVFKYYNPATRELALLKSNHERSNGNIEMNIPLPGIHKYEQLQYERIKVIERPAKLNSVRKNKVGRKPRKSKKKKVVTPSKSP